MKQLDIFKDKEFQSLPLEQKQTIAQNYFDKESADEEFLKLDAKQQNSIRDNFTNAQLEFDISDTRDKLVNAFTPTPAAIATEVSPTLADPGIHDSPIAPNRDGTMPKPAPAPTPEPFSYAPDNTLIQSDDSTATRAFAFDENTGKSLSPSDQDIQIGTENAQILTGDGSEFVSKTAPSGNAMAGMVNRSNELLGNSLKFVQHFEDEAVGTDSDQNTQFFGNLANWITKDKLDKKDVHTTDEVKAAFKAGGLFDVDTWLEALYFGAEQGPQSVADMGHMVLQLPAYIASRSYEMADTRAKNDGRKKATTQDIAITLPLATGSALLDKLGLKAMTSDIVTTVGKSAMDAPIKETLKIIGAAVGKGAIKETATEIVQEGGLEYVAEQAGTEKGATFDEGLERGLWGGLAGFVMGSAMSTATATGSEVTKAYTQTKKEQLRDAHIQDTYNKQMMGSGLVLNTDDAAFTSFKAEHESRIKTIQDEFANLAINHPDKAIPADAIENVTLQEQVVAEAKAEGLNVSDNNGLNAIDAGFAELEQEIGSAEPLTPKAAEPTPPATPVIEKPVIGQPEPEAKQDTARLTELQAKTEDELTIDRNFELEDLQAETSVSAQPEAQANNTEENFPGENPVEAGNNTEAALPVKDGFEELAKKIPDTDKSLIVDFSKTNGNKRMTYQHEDSPNIKEEVLVLPLEEQAYPGRLSIKHENGSITAIPVKHIDNRLSQITKDPTLKNSDTIEQQGVQDETRGTTASGAAADRADNTAGVPAQEQGTPDTGTVEGSDSAVRNSDQRLDGPGAPGVDQDGVPAGYEPVGGYQTAGGNNAPEQGTRTDGDAVLPKPDERHLDENILSEYGISTSADFVDTFYDVESYETTDSTGAIVKRDGLAQMKNLDWMGKILDRFVDYKGFNDMPDLPRPKQEIAQYMTQAPELQAETANSYMKAPTPKQLKQIEETNHYARLSGYDEAGANYIPNYAIVGAPHRPQSDNIQIGNRTVALPPKDKPINADSLRVYLSDIIGNRLYDGKIKGRSALGVYQRKSTAIRVKNYSDIEVMAHEMAHFLDFFHNNTSKKAEGSFFRKEILKNKEEIKALSYTTETKHVISEGFAEFVRLWLTNYNALVLVAPGMVKDFEAKLAKDRKLQFKIEVLQDGMHKFYFQGPLASLRGKRGGELDPIAKKINRSQAEIGKAIRQSAIDKIHSVKRIEAAIRGDVAPDAIDSAYKTLQLVNGSASIMHTAMNIGVPTVLDNGDLSYSGKPLNEIFAPATKISVERVMLLEDFLVAKRASELKTQGRENLITAQEIEAGLALSKTYPEFETIFSEYQEFNNAMLDFYVGMKLITSDQRENFKEMNKNYVPFHRITESIMDGKVSPAKIGQRLTGGTHSLNNIMENIVNGIESNIKQALISRGKSVLYTMLEESGQGGVYATRVGAENKLVKSDMTQQAKKVAQLMMELGVTVSKDGLILSGNISSENIIDVTQIEDNLLANPSALEFWTHGHKPTSTTAYIDTAIIDGQKVYFEVHDVGLVEALTSFSGVNYNSVVQGLMSAKNIITWNITNNPLFYLTNFTRDTVSAAVLSKNNFIPVISSITGMYHFTMNTKTYKKFMASGAGYGTRSRSLGGETDVMGMLEVNRGLEIMSKVISAMESGADRFEYGTRIGEFALAKKAGKSNMQAGFEGREISTDFAIKGSNQSLTSAMATVPFMKAAINGMDKTARRIFSLNGEMKLGNAAKFRNQMGELQTQKIKFYAYGAIIAGFTLALWFNNKDDERWKKLSKDQKQMNWFLFIPGSDKPIKIPRPFDIGFAFATVPEIMADAIYTEKGEDALKDFMWGLKAMFSVGDIPGLFQPGWEHLTNKKWTGAPLIPSMLQNLDDLSDQYDTSTPLLYRKIGKATGASPILTQHYVDGILGLTAKMIEENTEKMLWDTDAWGARPFEQNALEFITYRFRGKEQPTHTIYSEKYYELAQKAGGVKASLALKKKKAFLDNGKDISEYAAKEDKGAYKKVDDLMSRYNKTLTNIKNGVEFITYDKTLSKAEKEKQINEAYAARTDMFKEITGSLEIELKKLEEK